MTFANTAILVGLVAMVVPLLLHLFSRRRYDEVEWAAMQFLTVSTRTRRRLFLEQFWLMLLRMLLVLLLVLAFAAPRATISQSTSNSPRDIVILIDGSASMGLVHNGRTVADTAKEWADNFIRGLPANDRVTVMQVKVRPVPLLDKLTTDRDQARSSLDWLAPPRGNADWPTALQSALELLRNGQPIQDVIVLTDGQRHGWADDSTLARWASIRKLSDGTVSSARIWVHDLTADWPRPAANASLDPITTSRAVAAAGRDLTFRSVVRASGSPPFGPLNIAADGRVVGKVTPTGEALGATPITFTQRFTPGSHLIALMLPPDDLLADNQQEFALDVLPVLPVLIVDGKPTGTTGGSDFIRDALAPAGDVNPAFAVRVVNVADFTPASLSAEGSGLEAVPRVLILANLEKPTAALKDAVENYLTAGGSVLTTVGDRCDAAAWNRVAFRGGRGFLPARLVTVVGDEDNIEKAPRPEPNSFTHPAFELFRDPLPGGLQTAYFPRRWKVDTTAGVNGSTGTTVAALTAGEPLLVERSFGRGRVLLATVPLDNSWRTNLIRLPDFVRLVHELTYYLAGCRAAERNLASGQPIVFTPRPDEPAGPVLVQYPDGSSETLPVAKWPVVIYKTGDPGAYTLTTSLGKKVYFTIRGDARESNLTPCDDADRAAVRDAIGGLEYISTPDEIAVSSDVRAVPVEFWWVLLIAVIVLLLSELWYTRRLTDRGYQIN